MYKVKLTTAFKISAEGMEFLIKGCIFSAMCINFVIVGSSGCVPSTAQLSQTERKLEGVLDIGDVGALPACYLTFNEPHFVNRIVIHTDYPIKGIDVYVSTGKDLWYRVKQFKRPISGATSVNIGRKTDIIRVVRKPTYVGGSVQNIEAYGN